MKLNLKKFFSNEDEKPFSTTFALDLSDVEISGTKLFTNPAEVMVLVRGSNGAVQLELKMDYEFSVPCDRCMEMITKRETLSLTHIVLLSSEDCDDGEYIRIPSEELDVSELAREDIILSLPIRFLCSEDCKGLCPVCGKNLNEGSCSCKVKKVDPRMEILKQLIDD